MLDNPLLQLLCACIFLVLVCTITYKMTLPVGLKIIELCLESSRFRAGVSFFLALIFGAVGILQLIDFMEETGPDLSRFFPLSFLITAIFLFLGLLSVAKKKLQNSKQIKNEPNTAIIQLKPM